CDLGFAVYGSKSYLARNGRPAELEDVSEHDLIVHNRDRLFYFEPLNWTIDQCQPRTIPMVTNCLRSMMDAARQDVGLAVLPCLLADREPELVRVIGGHNEMVQRFWIYMHREVRKNPEVRQFIEFFTKWAKRNSSVLLGDGRDKSSAPN
ncbi:MAG: LysR substrate-binding domain-containing protein, partial [Pseudomonadota bacterium]